MVPLCFSSCDASANVCRYNLNAIVDPGSPISHIKDSCVPLHARLPAPSGKCEYFGINNSPLTILGLFERDVIVENIFVKLIFKIVPDTAISYMALLGC